MKSEDKDILFQAAAIALHKTKKYDLKNRPDAAGKFYNHFRQEAYALSKGELKDLFPKLKRLRNSSSEDHKFTKKIILRSLDILFDNKTETTPAPATDPKAEMKQQVSDGWGEWGDYYGWD